MIMSNTVSIDGLGVEFTYPEEVQNRESNAESFISIIKSVNRLPLVKTGFVPRNEQLKSFDSVNTKIKVSNEKTKKSK